jgi:hypothetical protein
VAVRVDGHGSLRVWEGLPGSTRVEELLARASAENLCVLAGATASSVWRDSRLLRANETLEGAGVPRSGGEVRVCAGGAGGMRWSWLCLGLGSRQRAHVHPATAGTTLTASGEAQTISTIQAAAEASNSTQVTRSLIEGGGGVGWGNVGLAR